LHFLIPGTHADLVGEYSLDGKTFDFHGTLRLDAKLSQMTSGWKSILLKPVDPFFAKHGAGTEVPFKITGTAINPFATPNPSTGVLDRSISNFQLVNNKLSLINEGRPPLANAIPVSARPNGEFEIGNVGPGTYDLVASATDPATRQTFYGRTPVEVRNADVSGVSLVISRNLSLKGQVEIRGTQAASIKPESLSIQLQSLGSISGGGPPMRPDMNGTFSNDRLPEEKYRVQVNGVPQDGYIQDIRSGTTSVFDDGFTPSPNSTLQVIVNSDGITLKGSVRSTKGQLVAAATIALVPPQAQRQNPVRFKQATTDDKERLRYAVSLPGNTPSSPGKISTTRPG
jgi:hypothetical protein